MEHSTPRISGTYNIIAAKKKANRIFSNTPDILHILLNFCSFATVTAAVPPSIFYFSFFFFVGSRQLPVNLLNSTHIMFSSARAFDIVVVYFRRRNAATQTRLHTWISSSTFAVEVEVCAAVSGNCHHRRQSPSNTPLP